MTLDTRIKAFSKLGAYLSLLLKNEMQPLVRMNYEYLLMTLMV